MAEAEAEEMEQEQEQKTLVKEIAVGSRVFSPADHPTLGRGYVHQLRHNAHLWVHCDEKGWFWSCCDDSAADKTVCSALRFEHDVDAAKDCIGTLNLPPHCVFVGALTAGDRHFTPNVHPTLGKGYEHLMAGNCQLWLFCDEAGWFWTMCDNRRGSPNPKPYSITTTRRFDYEGLAAEDAYLQLSLPAPVDVYPSEGLRLNRLEAAVAKLQDRVEALESASPK